MSSIKCGGFCCERFCTHWSPSEWQDWADAIKNGAHEWVDDKGKSWGIGNERHQKDVLHTADMLILLETDETHVNPENYRINGQFYYTCKHFNKETRLCNDYKNRPLMCSGYPKNTKKACVYEGCKAKCNEPV